VSFILVAIFSYINCCFQYTIMYMVLFYNRIVVIYSVIALSRNIFILKDCSNCLNYDVARKLVIKTVSF